MNSATWSFLLDTQNQRRLSWPPRADRRDNRAPRQACRPIAFEPLAASSFGSLERVSAFMPWKRGVDWVTALLAGIILLPFLGLLALAIRLDSRGPALFRQQRIGYNGVPFTLYKFRTMTRQTPKGEGEGEGEGEGDGEGGGGLTHAMTRTGDDRITPLGRWLRHTRIDELPQIINILRGEMSWIGPRPEMAVLSRWYEGEIDFYRYRHVVLPGIAGWAQVNQGHVTEIGEVRDKLKYDSFYIRNFSPWIDLVIIALTVRTVLTGFGAR